MTHSTSRRARLLVWLILCQSFFLVSLAIGTVMWGFSGEVASLYFALLIGYAACTILSATMSWIGFSKDEYRKAYWWNGFPIVWFAALAVVFWTG